MKAFDERNLGKKRYEKCFSLSQKWRIILTLKNSKKKLSYFSLLILAH